MELDEFTKKLKEDKKFLRLVIRSLYRLTSLASVALLWGLPEDTFDVIFVDDPDFEDLFTSSVKKEFSKIQAIIAWPRINEALRMLSAATSSDDEAKSITAASALIRAQQMLGDLMTKKDVEEDDIDKIWKEMQNERQS